MVEICFGCLNTRRFGVVATAAYT
eukprot:COSAG02_NODE_27505_length_608_cov_0.801572_1_plen_23_part_01